jgi:glycosyltransferase involved in cell wall biosynthesis
MRPEVTVVITTLDRRDYLREAVASVRAQAAVIHELIVVDNGSADGTGDWLASQDDLLALHAGRDQALTRSSNISVARNAGLARARGAYVWFLDDDDRLRPGALATLARALDEHPAAVAAVGARTRFGDGVVGGRIAHPLRRVVGDLGPELLLSWGWIPSQALCRAATLRQVGGWREDVPHSEDLDMWARIGSLGPVVLEPATVVEYRVHRAQSRLRDPAALRDLLLRPHQSALAGGDAARGRALRQAGRSWDRANVAFAAGDHRSALRHTLRAAALAPRLLRSPAVGPLATRMIVRSALRSWGPARRWLQSRPAPRPGDRPRRGTGFLS